MARDLHRHPFNESTLAKLGLFGAYFAAWLGVFIGSRRVTIHRIRLFDFFCGPGEDSLAQKGSPVLMLEKLQGVAAQIQECGYEVEVYFNDADPEKIEALKETVTARKLLEGPYTVHFSSQDFQERFDALYPKLANSANLLLLDQHGVRFFTPAIFARIRVLSLTDTLVFMSASYIRRFKDEPEFNQHLETKAIFSADIPHHQVHRAVVEYYRRLVPPHEKYFLAPFSLKSGSNIYGVIFGTQNHKGLEKFLETAWKIDPDRGEADFDIDREGFVRDQGVLFADMSKPKKTQLFEQQFEEEILAGKLKDTAAIYDFVHQQGFLMKHANPVLRRLKGAKRIDGDLSGIAYQSLQQPKPLRLLS